MTSDFLNIVIAIVSENSSKHRKVFCSVLCNIDHISKMLNVQVSISVHLVANMLLTSLV